MSRKRYTAEQIIGKLRDELLNREIFDTLLEAKVLVGRWRRHYDQARPHSALGYRPPTPEALDDACFYKVGDKKVSFYCPERVFMYMAPRKTRLRLDLFTGGEPLGDVKQFDYEKGGQKWGGITVTDERALRKTLPWVEESCRRIKQAIKNNEPTGWYAEIEESPEEADDECDK